MAVYNRHIHSGNATDTNYAGEKKFLEFDAGFSELRKLTSLYVSLSCLLIVCFYKSSPY